MNAILDFFNMIYGFLLDNIYTPLNNFWSGLNIPLDFKWVVIGIGVIVLLILLILIFKPKKRKIYFYTDGTTCKIVKCKYNKPIKYPAVKVPQGQQLEGWYTDQSLTEKYESTVLDTKKKLRLYAKFIMAENEADLQQTQASTQSEIASSTGLENQNTQNVAEKTETYIEPLIPSVEPGVDTGVVEETINTIPLVSMTIGEIYDEIRYALLGYERAKAFTKIGVIRKQFIAEMFEKDGKINLYLAIDPEVMQEKGYKVEKFTEREFSVVPCKKVISGVKEYAEALKLIEETMIFNNLVKNENNCVKKIVSDEQARKSGFAFFIKNENVVTSAEEYYKLLRASTNCYTVSPKAKNLNDASNKMIFKIFKKDDEVYLYLALDAESEGLEFVGYDKNFTDTPAMFVVKTAEDFNKANVLIDKLMFRYEMEKHPEKAELLLDEPIQKNCGFGYRIRY